MYTEKRRKANPHYSLRAQGNKRHTVQDEKDETILLLLVCSFLASTITVLLLKIVEVV